jgi:hypothetical protein
MIFWTILFEFDTVIIPAYFPFVLTLLVLQAYNGNIQAAAIVFLILSLVDSLHKIALYFVQLIACLPTWLIDPSVDGYAASGPSLQNFVRGSMVDREISIMMYIQLWSTGLTYLTLLVLFKTQMTLLYLWVGGSSGACGGCIHPLEGRDGYREVLEPKPSKSPAVPGFFCPCHRPPDPPLASPSTGDPDLRLLLCHGLSGHPILRARLARVPAAHWTLCGACRLQPLVACCLHLRFACLRVSPSAERSIIPAHMQPDRA